MAWIPASLLLLLVLLVGWKLSPKVPLPACFSMLLAGAAISLIPMVAELPVGRGPAVDHLLLNLLLPPLLFEAAWMLNRHELRADLLSILLLVSTGLLCTWGAAAYLLHGLFAWSWAPALLLGAILSATDPVSVLATLRVLKIHGRLPLFLEAESLLNDATGAILFLTVLAGLTGAQPTVSSVTFKLVLLLLLSCVVAIPVVFAVRFLARRLRSRPILCYLLLIACTYMSYYLAEEVGGSGIAACIMTGLGTQSLRRDHRAELELWWGALASAANVGVFLLLGIELMCNRELLEVGACVAAILCAITARALAIGSHGLCFSASRYAIPVKEQALMVWGGLRGALGLSLAVGIPQSLPYRQAVLMGTVAIVAFSSLVQAPTMSILLRFIKSRKSVPQSCQ